LRALNSCRPPDTVCRTATSPANRGGFTASLTRGHGDSLRSCASDGFPRAPHPARTSLAVWAKRCPAAAMRLTDLDIERERICADTQCRPTLPGDDALAPPPCWLNELDAGCTSDPPEVSGRGWPACRMELDQTSRRVGTSVSREVGAWLPRGARHRRTMPTAQQARSCYEGLEATEAEPSAGMGSKQRRRVARNAAARLPGGSQVEIRTAGAISCRRLGTNRTAPV